MIVCLFIFRVQGYNGSCDPRTELSLSIAERAQTVQRSFTSVWNSSDVQTQDVQDPCEHTDCRNCSKIVEPLSKTGDSQSSSLDNGNVRLTPGEASPEDGQTDEQTVAVCVSLVVNGDARSASSSCALHSKKVLSDDAAIKSDGVQADRSTYDESWAVESQKKEDISCMTQDLASLPTFNMRSWNSDIQAVDGSCLNKVEQISDKDTCYVRHSEVPNDSSGILSEIEQNITPGKGFNDAGTLDNGGPVSAVEKTGALYEVCETAVDELVIEAAFCEDTELAGGNMCLDGREISAPEVHYDILDSGDGMLVSPKTRLLNSSGQKLDDLCGAKCGQDLDVQAGVAESTDSDCTALHDVRSADNKLVTSSEDTECHAVLGNSVPVNAHDIVPDHYTMEKQRSAIASDIEELQAWINSTNSDARWNAVSVPLSVLEGYADELQKKKLELDRLNTQVKELERYDKDVCRDERYRLVSVHAQLHGTSATIYHIALKAVCISYQLSHSCNFRRNIFLSCFTIHID